MKPEVMNRMRLYMLKKHKDIPMCVNCEHFRMHYIRCGNRYLPVDGGHCVDPRIKPRDAWDLCDCFTSTEALAPVPAQTRSPREEPATPPAPAEA